MTGPHFSHDTVYRPSIDGLRALAVLSVIIFHLNPAWLSGGFVGVDVFFVISGYLITQQIQKDLSAGTFSFKSFYQRRIRRIAPALLLMLVVVSLVALAVLTPGDSRSFAKSLVAQGVALQNFVFLDEGDYFKASDTKVLLHTWSLAVEEQYYLFWPLLLVFMHKRAKRSTVLAVLTLIVGSFFLSFVLQPASPRAAFYLITTRAWELAFGGLAALLPDLLKPHLAKREWVQGRRTNVISAVVSGVGLVGLLLSFFYIDSSTTFLGGAIALPVLGTFLIITQLGQTTSMTQRLLSHPALVSVGLLSYSLYLWHWPILVFMRHLNINIQDSLPFIGFWVLVFLLSYTSYRWVETPIRKRVLLPTTRGLLTAVGLTFVALSLFAVHIWVTQGAAYRYSAQAQAFLTADLRTQRCSVASLITEFRQPVCTVIPGKEGKKKVLLWGNSHAGMWVQSLTPLAKNTQATLLLNTKNCRPISGTGDCRPSIKANVLDRITPLAITDVVLASTWHAIDEPAMEQQLFDLVASLIRQHVQVWFVIDPPASPQFNPLHAYAQNPKNPVAGTMLLQTYNQNAREKELAMYVRLKERHEQVRLIDPSSTFCDGVYCYAGKGSEVWYVDSNHLSNAGAAAARQHFKRVFEQSNQ